jgi:hypothetical protein
MEIIYTRKSYKKNSLCADSLLSSPYKVFEGLSGILMSYLNWSFLVEHLSLVTRYRRECHYLHMLCLADTLGRAKMFLTALLVTGTGLMSS